MPSFQAHLKQPGQASKSWHENIDERDLPFYSRSVGSTREPKRRSRVNGVLGGAIVEGVASKLASHAESYLSLLSVVWCNKANRRFSHIAPKEPWIVLFNLACRLVMHFMNSHEPPNGGYNHHCLKKPKKKKRAKQWSHDRGT
jgi:hypothetical protein